MSFRRFAPASLFLLLFTPSCGEPPAESSGDGGDGGSTTTTTSTTTSTTLTTSTTSSTSSQGGTGGDEGWGGGGAMDPDLFAQAGADEDVYRGQLVFLYGYYTWDGSMSGFESSWEQVSGEPVTLSDPSQLTPTFTAPDILGPLVFRLRVRDDYGFGTPDEVTVNVVDQLPIVDAGPDMGGPAGATLTLTGTASDADDPALTYTWTQVEGPTTPLDDPTALLPKLVVPANLDEPLVYALTANDGFETSAPDWVTVRRVEGADPDGDLLDDAAEAQLGTDPTSADTDADGIPDGWEVLGHEDVDYAALGCDPLHRDLLVELDYQEFTDDNGALHSAHPSPAVEAALASFYASLPVPNPDGLPGIDIRFVDDSVLPQTFTCVYGGPIPSWGDASPSNFLYREAFHRVQICLGDPVFQYAGIAEIGGRSFAMMYPEMNADPADDLTEEAAFRLYSMFNHEMGHNLGLRHGGDEDLNYKPIYPSLMNYAFTYTLEGSPLTIAGTKVAFSKGVLPPVNECALVEQGIFEGVPSESLAFLPSYLDMGWTVAADGSVDWNRDATISSTSYTLVIRGSSGIGDPQDCKALHDHDDHFEIAHGMAHALPSNPSAAGPGFVKWKKPRPQLAP